MFRDFQHALSSDDLLVLKIVNVYEFNPLSLLHQYTCGTFIFPHTISLVYQCGDHAQMAESKFRFRTQLC